MPRTVEQVREAVSDEVVIYLNDQRTQLSPALRAFVHGHAMALVDRNDFMFAMHDLYHARAENPDPDAAREFWGLMWVVIGSMMLFGLLLNWIAVLFGGQWSIPVVSLGVLGACMLGLAAALTGMGRQK